MKRLFYEVIFAVSLFGFSAICRAQDCSNWSNEDMRGTWAMWGSGWMDFSKVIPTLPSGTIPMSTVGASSFDGWGNGTGWTLVNAGGMQLSMELVNMQSDVKPDCSVVTSYSIKLKELGITLGPVSRVLVIAGSGRELELHGMQVGTGPGTAVDLTHTKRISIEVKQFK